MKGSRGYCFQWLDDSLAPFYLNDSIEVDMKDYSYNLWTLTELRIDDPRAYLDVIVANVRNDKIQAIKYKDDTVFVISEGQYKKLKTM